MIDMKFMTRGINLFILYQESHLKSQLGSSKYQKEKKKWNFKVSSCAGSSVSSSSSF